MRSFAEPNSLLGQLQRGRGSAIRALSGMSSSDAEAALMQCLCTRGMGEYLITHVYGYVEAILALRLPVAKMLDHLEAMAAKSSEDEDGDLVFMFKMCASLGERGNAECVSFIRRHVVDGAAWRIALGEGFELLDEDVWMKIMGRLSDTEIAVYVEPKDEKWIHMAAKNEKVARIIRSEQARRGGSNVSEEEKIAALRNYETAALSQERWQVLKSYLAKERAVAADWLVEGLWDANEVYREHCILLVELMAPGVMERLRTLALGSDGIASAARKRLDEGT